MGRTPTKACENIYYQYRKRAAEWDDRLKSREGAAEQLGVSVSTLADYELGQTKFIPAESVCRMAEVYDAPILKTHFCNNNCPIGACTHLALPQDEKPLEQVVLSMVRDARSGNLEAAMGTLVSIACDGHIDKAERNQLANALRGLDGLLSGLIRLNMVGLPQK